VGTIGHCSRCLRNLVPIGLLRKGVCRDRAFLFKFFADRMRRDGLLDLHACRSVTAAKAYAIRLARL
jgi:hypothetical protein